MPEIRRIPDLILERYALGELPREQMQEISQRLQSDPEAAKRLEELKASNQQILSQYKVQEEVGTIKRKVHLRDVEEKFNREKAKKPVWLRLPMLVPAAGLAALLAISLLPYLVQQTSVVTAPEGNRIKGLPPQLQVFLKQDAAPVQLKDGDTARQGDVLQLRYISAGRKYGMIFSIDGRGSFTLHFPEEPGQPLELNPDGKVSLKHAYELDDAPKFERFYFISSDQPFAARQILDRVESAFAPEEFHQEVITLKKDQP
jgi:hypothetical protein